MKLFPLVSGLGVTLLATVTSATIVNVQFNQIDTPPTPVRPVYTGTAAAPDSGTYWNQVGTNWNGGAFQVITGANLKDSTGVTTPASVTIGSATQGVRPLYQANGATGNNLLDLGMQDSQSGTLHTIPLTISGLDPGRAYRLWLYSGGINTDWGTTFTFGGVSQTALNGLGTSTSSTIPAAPNLGVTYVYFSNVLPDSSGTIAGTFQGAVLSGVYRPFVNGFQFQAIPEPSTLLLLAAGGLWLRWAWRRS